MKSDQLFLSHIRQEIQDIDDLVQEGRVAFDTSRKNQKAMVRSFEVIGEAVKRLSPAIRATEPEVPWTLIAGMRDRLIHGYFSVNLQSVWNTAVNDIKPLSAAVERMLQRPHIGNSSESNPTDESRNRAGR